MRFLSVLIALIIGIVMGIIFLNNAHGVILNLDPFVRTPAPPATPYRVVPLWAIMLVCALIGFFLGWLVGITAGYVPKPAGPKPPPPPPKKPEPDYLLINAPVDRRKP